MSTQTTHYWGVRASSSTGTSGWSSSSFSTLGHLVHTLVDEALPPETYRRQWVATGMMSGIYFYRIQAGGFVQTKRLVLIK